MLFAVDIGNTNIVCTVFDGDRIFAERRFVTNVEVGLEYQSKIEASFADSRNEEMPNEPAKSRSVPLKSSGIKDIAISSVVPSLTPTIAEACKRIFQTEPYLIGSDLAFSGDLPVKLPEGSVHELGTDLLSNAVSAWNLFGSANIAVDFGTALTIMSTDSRGVIRGLSISPGLFTALKALSSNAAQLPEVPLQAPPSVLGMTTVEAIQSGIVFGYTGLVEYIIAQAKKELRKFMDDENTPIEVVATGGLSGVLRPLTDVFTRFDRDLTVNGIRLIYEATHKKQAN